MVNWQIRASSGRESVFVNFMKLCKDPKGQVFFASEVTIKGLFFGRFSKKFEGDVIDDYTVTLHQICLYKDPLEIFLKQLEAWLSHPLRISIDFIVGHHDGQRLRFTIDKRDDRISSEEKPVFFIEYTSGTFQLAQWMFVVDQSCIRLLAEELAVALQMC